MFEFLKRDAKDTRPQGAPEEAKVDSEVGLLSAAIRDKISSHLMTVLLSPMGLSEVTPRLWIDGSKPPARRLFQLQLLKGAGVKAMWGYSLDFVPHIAAKKMAFHASNKTAKLDVTVDPKGMRRANYLRGEAHFERDLRMLLEEAIPRALRDWERTNSYEGMLDLMEEYRDKNDFGFYNYTQNPLAHMFLLAKVGRTADANKELQLYCQGLHEKEANRLQSHLANIARNET